MKTYSTVQVARLLGIGADTLHRWMRGKKVPSPPVQLVGGVSIRLWSQNDIDKAKKYKVTRYWGKGGRKKTTKK